MSAQIRPNRLAINDRFPMLGFTIRTDGEPRRAEVTIATSPDLFSNKAARTSANFFSTGQLGPLSIPGDEAVYVVPPEVLARFIGSERIYFGLATAPAANGADYVVDAMPTADSPYISIADLSGRSLRRVRLFPHRNRPANGGYGDNGISELVWAGDKAAPGQQPATATNGNGNGNGNGGVAGNGNAGIGGNGGNGNGQVVVPPNDMTAQPGQTAPNGNGGAVPAPVDYDDGFGPMPPLPEESAEPTESMEPAQPEAPVGNGQPPINGGDAVDESDEIPTAQALDLSGVTVSPDMQAMPAPAVTTISQLDSLSIQATLASNPTLLPMVLAARAAAETGLVSVGIGPQLSAGLLGGAGIGAGIIFSSGNTLGVYGGVEVDAGFIASIGASLQLTVLKGGIDSFNGVSYVAGISGGEGLTAGAAAIFDADRNFLGVSLQGGVGLSLTPLEVYTGVQRQIASQLSHAQAYGPHALDYDPSKRSFIVADEQRGMSAERRNFGKAANDMSGETTLSVSVPNMPPGGSLRWRIQDDGFSRDRIAIVDSSGGLQTSATGTTVKLRALRGGVAEIAAAVYNADGTRIESEVYAISAPRFVWIGQDAQVMPHLTGNLNMSGTEVANMFSTARDALEQRYRAVNTRFVWADHGMSLPAHLQLASDPLFPGGVRPDTNVVLGRVIADPATVDPASGATIVAGHMGQAFFPVGVIPGDPTTINAGNALDNYEIAQIHLHAFLTPASVPVGSEILSAVDDGFRTGSLTNGPRDDALIFYGRMVGSVMAHEAGHVLLRQPHLAPGVGEIMVARDDQSMEELTGVQLLPGTGGAGDTFVVLPAADMRGFSPTALSTLTDRDHFPARPPLVARSFTLALPQVVNLSFNESFTINWDEVQSINQPTNMSCWAAAAAMVVGWRDRVSLAPETIAEIGGRTTATGLDPAQVGQFAQEIGLVAEAPQSYTQQAFRDLLENYGPLWVGAAVPSLHVIVVTGMYNEDDKLFVRVTDPWDRAVGTPGAPGPYASTHQTGSRYILTWEDFVDEYEAAAINYDHVNLQILHAADTGLRQPNRGEQTPPGYAQALQGNGETNMMVEPKPMPDPAQPVPGAVPTPPVPAPTPPIMPPPDEGFGPNASLSRQSNQRNGVSYDLAQLAGLVAPPMSPQIAMSSPMPGTQIALTDWPYIDGPSGRSRGGVAIDWSYAAGAVGNVAIRPADGAQALDGWRIAVSADIARHQALPEQGTETVAKLMVTVRTVFARDGEADQMATSQILLCGDGQFETQHQQELPTQNVAAE